MMGVRKIKNGVICTLLIVIVIMVMGFFALAHDYNFISKPGPAARWDVEFTSIAEGEKTGGAVSRKKPYHTGTYASFFVDFVSPGDSMTYDIQVSNRGNLDAYLKDIIYVTSPNKEEIKYELIGVNEGDMLKAGASKNFKIKVSYILHSNVAVTFNKPISITFNYVQHI